MNVAPACLDGCDINDDGGFEIADALFALRHLFLGDAPPAWPFAQCGADRTDDALRCTGHPTCGA